MKTKPATMLSWIELSAFALKQNIRSLAKLVKGRPIAASVKSNAYGHGISQIATMLLPMKEVTCVTVHSVEEARQCRFAGWNRAIMLLGPVAPNEVDGVIEYDLEPTIFDIETLDALGKLSKRHKRKIKTHLKLETGTNRQGITNKELPSFVKLYKKYPSLGGICGASTHFANIEDTTNHAYAEKQLDQFKSLVNQLKKNGCNPKLLHTASSAAAILFEKTRFDLVRPGISVYGHWPSMETYLSN
jgi:alanine racemase